MPRVRVYRIDKRLPLPEYRTDGALGFDLYVRMDKEIAPRTVARIPCNVIVELPAGYGLLLLARSSLPLRGLCIPHGVGLIDRDYCGPLDEINLQVLNFTDRPVLVKRGERLAQAVLVPMVRARLDELDEAPAAQSRGGFGSTGV